MQHPVRRAAWLGAISAFGPGVILFGWYYAKHHHELAGAGMPWSRIALLSCVLAPLTGALFGGAIRGLVALTDRPILSGIVGGSLASIITGVFAVAVFGSYHAPYAGSLEISVMTIAACWALSTVLTVDALGKRDLVAATGIVIVAALITAAVTLATAYVVAPHLFDRNGIFYVTRGLAKQHGAVPIGALLGMVVGAIVGLHLGIAMAIARARSSTRGTR